MRRRTEDCPRCHVPLFRVQHEGTMPLLCRRCEGLFVLGTDIDRALGESAQAIHEAEIEPVGERLGCPRGCASTMNTYAIRVPEGEVVYDVCAFCRGIWFDGGELEAARSLGASELEEHQELRDAEADKREQAEAERAAWLSGRHRVTEDRKRRGGAWDLFGYLTGMPVETVNRLYRFPIVTWLLVGSCLLMFGAQIALGREAMRSLLFVPSALFRGELPLVAWLAPMFMHASPGHLFSNLYFLKVFGDNVEDRLGRPIFFGFYLLCGILASLAHAVTTSAPNVPALGASGAISGILAAYLVFFPGVDLTVRFFYRLWQVPAWIFLFLWFALQALLTLADDHTTGGGVAYGAHAGGFLAGWILAALAKRLEIDQRLVVVAKTREERARRRRQNEPERL